MRFALGVVLLVGCRGETVSAVSPDAAVDDALVVEVGADASTPMETSALDSAAMDTTVVDAGCASRPGNLLLDPSFEDMTPVDGGFVSAGWSGAESFGRIEDAAHCRYALTFVDKDGSGPRQFRTLPVKLPIGGKVRVRAKVKWLAGPKNAPGLFLYLIKGPPSGGEYFNHGTDFVTWNGDGGWYEHTHTFTNETGVEIDSFGFAILSNASTPQTLAADDAEVTIVGDGG